MKKEELIAQLQLLPDNADIFVRLNDRIAEPLLCIYSVEPHPNAEKLVGYIDTFFGTLERQLKEVGGDMVPGVLEGVTYPCHERLFQVCHHGRDLWGSCAACEEYEEAHPDPDEDA